MTLMVGNSDNNLESLFSHTLIYQHSEWLKSSF